MQKYQLKVKTSIDAILIYLQFMFLLNLKHKSGLVWSSMD